MTLESGAYKLHLNLLVWKMYQAISPDLTLVPIFTNNTSVFSESE